MAETNDGSPAFAQIQTGGQAGQHCLPRAFDDESPFWQVDKTRLGEKYWHECRGDWTRGGVQSDSPDPKVLRRRHEGRFWRRMEAAESPKHNLEQVYTMCVDQCKAFSRPINLSEVVPVLVAGWKKNGTWPEGQAAPASPVLRESPLVGQHGNNK